MNAQRLMEPQATSLDSAAKQAVRRPENVKQGITEVRNVEQLRGLKKYTLVAFLEGEKYVRHDNPDNMIGGFVHHTATVSPEAYVEEKAIVMAMAKVEKGVRLNNMVTVEQNAEIGRDNIVPVGYLVKRGKVVPPRVM